MAPEVMPGAQVVASKFMRRLAGKTLARLADNIMPEVCRRMTCNTVCFAGYSFFVDGVVVIVVIVVSVIFVFRP